MLGETDVLALIGNAATWVVFLALYLYERRRNAILQTERLRDFRAWMNFIADDEKRQIFLERPNGDTDSE